MLKMLKCFFVPIDVQVNNIQKTVRFQIPDRFNARIYTEHLYINVFKG